jgi:hypothetical protein
MNIKNYALLIAFIFFAIHCTILHGIGNLPGDKPGKKYTLSQLVVAHPPDPKTNIRTVNAKSKSNVPIAVGNGFQTSFCSFTKTATPVVVHPAAGALFPDDGNLSQSLDTFLTSIKEDAYFTVYFSKIHLLYLHELYTYLTKIYTVFNLTPLNSLEQYLDEETKNCIIKKKLIINHLISIIEAQSNQAILARFPAGLPKHLATYTGSMLMKNDYGANLDMLLKDSEKTLLTDPSVQVLLKPTYDTKRTQYLTFLGNYLKFFNAYTASLSKQDSSTGFNTFVAHAQRIKKIIDQTPQVNSSLSPADRIKALQNVQQINPPLFFYDTPSLRALKLIPQIAQSLPKNVENIPWPDALVKAATTGSTLKDKFGYESTIQLAYFTTKKGKKTKEIGQAKHLYVNIPTMQYIYVQEVLQQPAWMNSYDGIIKMLRACVGDFSILFDPVFKHEAILDPCLGCIIQNAAQQAGMTQPDDRSCKACSAYLEGIKNALNAVQVSSQTGITDNTGSVDTGSIE